MVEVLLGNGGQGGSHRSGLRLDQRLSNMPSHREAFFFVTAPVYYLRHTQARARGASDRAELDWRWLENARNRGRTFVSRLLTGLDLGKGKAIVALRQWGGRFSLQLHDPGHRARGSPVFRGLSGSLCIVSPRTTHNNQAKNTHESGLLAQPGGLVYSRGPAHTQSVGKR